MQFIKANLDKRIASLVKVRSIFSYTVRAAIYSFGTVLVVPWKRDVTLPCQSVGKPEPSVTWKQWGQIVKPSARVSLHPDGSLQIIDLHREDSGNYTCFVDNRHGSDQITHRLTVQGERNFYLCKKSTRGSLLMKKKFFCLYLIARVKYFASTYVYI